MIGCSQEGIQNETQENLATENNERRENPDDSGDPDPIGGDYETDLMAGQHTDSGNVIVSETSGNLDVTFETEGDWIILETHLYVGSQEDMPANNPGNPRIGQFPYKTDHGDGVTTFTYSNLGELAVGECTWVAAHAVVYNTVTNQEETAWGDGADIPGNSWAMYFEVCNGDGPF